MLAIGTSLTPAKQEKLFFYNTMHPYYIKTVHVNIFLSESYGASLRHFSGRRASLTAACAFPMAILPTFSFFVLCGASRYNTLFVAICSCD